MSTVVKQKAQEADDMIRRLAAEANGESTDTAQQQDNANQDSPDAQQQDDVQPNLQAVDTVGDRPDDHREVDELKRQLEKANQRWKTLQGQIGSKDQQIEQLHQLLAKMDQAPAAAAPADSPAPKQVGYTKEDTEAFGEDMIDLVQRIAGGIAGDQLAEANKTIDALKAQLDQVSQVSNKAVNVSFEDQLTKEFPDWEELNSDEGFIGWLQERPQRLNLFSGAAQTKDASGVVEFFQMYVDAVGWRAKSSRQQSKKEEQRRQVVPGKGRSATPSAQSQPEEIEWTRSKIADLYANKRAYAADEFAKLERSAAKAMKEERVDYSK